MSSIKDQSLSGFKWSAIGEISTHGISFVLGLVIARLLMPEDFGIIGMLAIFMAISEQFVNCGFGKALIRRIDRTEEDLCTAFYFNIVVGLCAYGILFVAAPYIADFFNTPVLKDVVRVLALTIIVHSLGIVPRALRTIQVDFRSQAYASIISVIISGGIGLYMAFSGYGVWALVWQQVTGALVSVCVIWWFARWWPAWTYSWQSFWSMFSYGSKLLASSMLHTIYRHASSLVIGKFYTPADLGFYDRGNRIAALPSTNLSSVLHKVTFPILAQYQEDNDRLLHVYHRYLAMTSMVIFFIMMLLAVVAKPLIGILLTDKWLGAVPFLQVFCLAFMFDSVCNLNNNLMFVKGWSGLFFKLEVIKKIIVTPFLLLAIPLGVMAICFVAVIHTVVDILCSTYYLRKLMGVELRPYGALVRYFFLSLLACMPAYFVCELDVSPWLSLSVGITISTMLYLGLLRHDSNLKELYRIVSNLIPVRP